jgi:thiol-disulfide isomerase/thioredoxin
LTEKRSKPVGKRILELAILFVVVAGGIITGVLISGKLGLAGRFAGNASNLPNQTNLKIEDPFPVVSVSDDEGKMLDFGAVMSGRKTIVGIVSSGCDACLALADALVEDSALERKGIQTVLLSPEPEFFRDNYRFPTFQVSWEFLEEQAIRGFPTIVGVDEHGRITFVSTGYSNQLTSSFLEKNL